MLYSQIGALAISYDLNQQGIISPPVSTINKILRRNDLIHQIIRFIRSDRVLDIFGEKYIMPDDVEYEYARATIDTTKEKLFVYHDSKLVVEHDYPLPKSSIDLSRFNL